MSMSYGVNKTPHSRLNVKNYITQYQAFTFKNKNKAPNKIPLICFMLTLPN